jgi:hypothetical protein
MVEGLSFPPKKAVLNSAPLPHRIRATTNEVVKEVVS